MFQQIDFNLKLIETSKTPLKKKLDACKEIEEEIKRLNKLFDKPKKSKSKHDINVDNIDEEIEKIFEELNEVRDEIDELSDIESLLLIKDKILECKKYIDTSNDLKILTVDNKGELTNITDKIKDQLLIEQIDSED